MSAAVPQRRCSRLHVCVASLGFGLVEGSVGPTEGQQRRLVCGARQRNRWRTWQALGGGGWILGNTIDGTQAEVVRVPFADTSTYPVPEGVADELILMLADILPTGSLRGVGAGRLPARVTGLAPAQPAQPLGAPQPVPGPHQPHLPVLLRAGGRCARRGGRHPPGARSGRWYLDEAFVDTLEVWADARARFPEVDPDRILVSGYSMGGYGTYRLVTLMPDSFASAVSVVGPPTNGIWTGLDLPSDNPFFTYPQLESTRHVPFWITHGALDEPVPVAGVARQAERLAELGHEHRFALHPAEDHITFTVKDSWAREAGWFAAHGAGPRPGRGVATGAPGVGAVRGRGGAGAARGRAARGGGRPGGRGLLGRRRGGSGGRRTRRHRRRRAHQRVHRSPSG